MREGKEGIRKREQEEEEELDEIEEAPLCLTKQDACAIVSRQQAERTE